MGTHRKSTTGSRAEIVLPNKKSPSGASIPGCEIGCPEDIEKYSQRRISSQEIKEIPENDAITAG